MSLLQRIFFYVVWPRIRWGVGAYRRVFVRNKLPNLSNQEVLLVGTSPQLDLNLLSEHSGKFSIGLHRVHKIYSKSNWRPDLLFLGDEALIMQQGRDIVESQDDRTVLVTGLRFWMPMTRRKSKVCYLSLRENCPVDFSKIDFDWLAANGTYVVGDTVLCLALQYCIKERVKKIIITGVNFNYEQGYVDKSISNRGINQPSPVKAREQYLQLRDVCDRLGIAVVHEF